MTTTRRLALALVLAAAPATAGAQVSVIPPEYEERDPPSPAEPGNVCRAPRTVNPAYEALDYLLSHQLPDGAIVAEDGADGSGLDERGLTGLTVLTMLGQGIEPDQRKYGARLALALRALDRRVSGAASVAESVSESEAILALALAEAGRLLRTDERRSPAVAVLDSVSRRAPAGPLALAFLDLAFDSGVRAGLFDPRDRPRAAPVGDVVARAAPSRALLFGARVAMRTPWPARPAWAARVRREIIDAQFREGKCAASWPAEQGASRVETTAFYLLVELAYYRYPMWFGAR